MVELTPDVASHRGLPAKDSVPRAGIRAGWAGLPSLHHGGKDEALVGGTTAISPPVFHTPGEGIVQRRSTRVCAPVNVTCQASRLAKHAKARACFGSGRVAPECWAWAHKAWRHSTSPGSSESLRTEDASDPFNARAFPGTPLPPVLHPERRPRRVALGQALMETGFQEPVVL